MVAQEALSIVVANLWAEGLFSVLFRQTMIPASAEVSA